MHKTLNYIVLTKKLALQIHKSYRRNNKSWKVQSRLTKSCSKENSSVVLGEFEIQFKTNVHNNTQGRFVKTD